MRNEQTTLDEVVEATVNYDGWWGQFRGPWLESDKMTEDEIMARTDEAWECGDYKEMINLMAELICRLQS